MDIRERAHKVLDRFDIWQLEAFIKLFGEPSDFIEDEEHNDRDPSEGEDE